MGSIKGLVLISRFEYLEKTRGSEMYQQFLKQISTEEENYARQPVIGANNYPESTIVKIDKILLEEFFDNNVEEFRKLGEWNATVNMPRFFSHYLEIQQAEEFLIQFTRLRNYLIGTGEMTISPIHSKTLTISIDYGQNIPRSVCLSEQGFIAGGMKMCGAKNIKIKEEICAGLSDSFICKYQITFE